MDIAEERISVQISTQELERRWKAVRTAMKDEGIDILIMQNTNQIKPGAEPKDLLAANNDFLRSKGFPVEKRLYAHGQGYDMVERPAIRDDEPMKLKANMNITIHPIAASKTAFAWVCDNYLVTDHGASECLHKTPKKIFEV